MGKSHEQTLTKINVNSTIQFLTDKLGIPFDEKEFDINCPLSIGLVFTFLEKKLNYFSIRTCKSSNNVLAHYTIKEGCPKHVCKDSTGAVLGEILDDVLDHTPDGP